MVRVVRAEDGSLASGRNRPGRGAWLCRDQPECLDLADRRKAFERALRGTIGRAAVEQLRIELRTEVDSGPPDRSEDPVP
jgi:predicted RNA-binding protein YlxR (DUF448 family)